MNTEPEPVPPPADIAALTAPAKHRHIPHLASWLLLGFVVFILAGILLPVFGQTAARSPQIKALGAAKQIGLALKLFAGDHNDKFPEPDVPELAGLVPHNSNIAFATLFPAYCNAEKLFGNSLSAYQTRTPDEKVDPPSKILEPGENVYAYVMGLNDRSNPDSPLVADGTDGTGHYVGDATKRGGVWKGKKAIVIHVNDSGSIENLTGPGDARYVPRPDGGNLLDVSGLGPGVRLLDPAVAPR